MTHSLKDRVVELRRVKASELMVNAGNWRLHPQFQRDALRGALSEVGIAGALIAYESKRQGGLTLIDGHLRQEDYPDTEWPILVLDVDDKEADVLLATLDPLAAMAEATGEKLAELTGRLDVEDEGLRLLLDQQKAEADLALLMKQVEVEIANIEKGEPRQLGQGQKSVKVVLGMEELADFERAILATANPNRAEAVMEICRVYLNGQKG